MEAAFAKAESPGGSRMLGPEQVMEGLVIGLFDDARVACGSRQVRAVEVSPCCNATLTRGIMCEVRPAAAYVGVRSAYSCSRRRSAQPREWPPPT